MTHPERTFSAPSLARWSAALLALFMWLAPLQSLAAPGPVKGKPAAAKAKKPAAAPAKKPVAGPAKKPPASQARKPVAKPNKAAAAKAPAKNSAKNSTPKGKQSVAAKKPSVVRVAPPPPPPIPADPLKLPLNASVAYVIDQDSEEVLFGKNDDDVRPIASLTKLMTGLIVVDAKLPLNERITITGEDVDRLKYSSSRLRVGTVLTRGEALHLTLMSSENRAAHALARTYPGGVSAFVSAMNVKARELGMQNTRYVDPTGLSSHNQSSARDIAVIAGAAYDRPLLRKYSVSRGYGVDVAGGREQYINSNLLVRTGAWDIGLQKTGYISEAGRCLVMQTKVQGRNLIMVFLDSASTLSRARDAELLRRWLQKHGDLSAGGKSDGRGA